MPHGSSATTDIMRDDAPDAHTPLRFFYLARAAGLYSTTVYMSTPPKTSAKATKRKLDHHCPVCRFRGHLRGVCETWTVRHPSEKGRTHGREEGRGIGGVLIVAAVLIIFYA